MRIPKPLADFIRFLAGNPPHTDLTGRGFAKAVPKERIRSDFGSIGVFTVHDAKRLLGRFEDVGVRFQVETDTSAGMENVHGTGILERYTVTIYVHKFDRKKAERIMDDPPK